MKVHREGNARFVDLSDEVKKLTLRPLLEAAVQAAAITIRDEIVSVIQESSPSGREYPLPGSIAPRVDETGAKIAGKFYTASAPGQPPAERTGNYAGNWHFSKPVWEGRHRVVASVYNPTRVGSSGEHPLWAILEYGTSDLVNFGVRMQPRPHVRKAVDRAVPKIQRQIRQIVSS